MFLVPSSSRAVDPYLQTLLLRVSLSRLGGKHRQLARQVGDSVSSPTNSMAGSSNANSVREGTTFIFGSWACTADGMGGFSSHLVTPNFLNRKPAPDSPTFVSPRVSTKKEFHLNSTWTTRKTYQLKTEFLVWSSST